MAIARLGYEPKRGYKNNDFSDDSEECESDCESDTGSKSNCFHAINKTFSKSNNNFI